jgi:hypothetical protein
MTATARPRSSAELLLEVQLRQAGIPFEREYRFAPPRRWRADFLVRDGWRVRNSQGALVEIEGARILIEVDGGGYVAGRHSRGAGMEADCEKASAAAILGYRDIRVTPKQVGSGQALEWVRAAIGEQAA